ncbi:unnamed protein product, partial [Candidula unifasciata]
KTDKVFSQQRSEPAQGPLLLGWSLLLYIHAEVQKAQGDESDAEMSKTLNQAHRLGNVALQLGVFEYLLDLVDSEHFSGKSEEASCAHYIVYTVISALLTLFQEESLGNIDVVYKIAGRLLKWDFIADTVWEKGEPEGLSILYNSAKKWFPLDFECFIQQNISLASASHYSAQKVKAGLHKIKSYTEAIDSIRPQDLQHTGEQGVFVLLRNKHPFHSGDFVIEQNCKGSLVTPSAGHCSFTGVGEVMRWQTSFNGWQYLMAEIQELLFQVCQGAGMVQTERLIRVTMIMELVKEVLKSDPASVAEFLELLNFGYQLILRFAVLNPAPPELLAHTVQCLVLAVPQFFSQVSHHLKQTGLLPFLTGNIDDLSKIQSGEGISQGLYGCVLAGTECAQGIYNVTLAVLDLVTKLVQVSSKDGGERDHLASVLFIMKEVFPRFHKWRYVDVGQRKNIGQKCLELFHQILNLAYMQEQHSLKKQKGPGLQEACVYSLLFTEAGRSLLEIVATGVDHIQMALSQQSSLTEGAGVDLLKLVEMSLSLLNRLLLLKPPELGQSPVEQALSSQPPGRQHQHIVATIAQYVYHRHSHKLPTMATVLLKRLATVSPMSILACLGNDAEPIRDLFLTRLQAVSEAVDLRVAILEMLSVCVDCQPGLIEIFLNVQQPDDKGTELGKNNLTLGRSSCLSILLDLIEVDKQCTYECPPVLLCAALDFIHSLWYGMREIPLALLREKQTFWPSVLASLKVDLPQINDDNEKSIQPLKLQIKLCSFALRIIALEIYAVASMKLDAVLKKTLQETFANDRLMYWSKMVRENMQIMSDASKCILSTPGQTVAEHPVLNLLLAWKNFVVMSSRYKVSEVQLTNRNKAQLLDDLLVGIQAQFEAQELTQIHVKLASIASALYFTLIKAWGKEFLESQLSETANLKNGVNPLVLIVQNLAETMHKTSGSDVLLPSVHIGLLGAVTIVLQQCGPRLEDPPMLISDLLPAVCSVFLQNSVYMPTFLEKLDQMKDGSLDPGTSNSSFGVHVKLQIVSCCLMVELLQTSTDLNASLRMLQKHGVVPCIISTIEAFFKVHAGIPYIYYCLLLLIKIADTETGASMLLNSNLSSHLCLALTSCYSTEDSFQPKSFLSETFSSVRPVTVNRHTLYCLSLDLFACMLRVLRHSFLDDALNVVGVHQDRLQQALEMARVVTSKPAIVEAEATCNFLLQLCAYHRQWRFHLPGVMANIMGCLMAMIQSYVALLIRPQYLLHLLEHPKGQESWSRADACILTSAVIQHQSSLEDVEQPTRKLLDAQNSILKLVTKGLACMKHFTPPLPEILLDQSTDVKEWEPVLTLGFSTPSLDDNDGAISFGTLLNCVTICVRLLSKTDGKFSPHKASPDDSNKNLVSRQVANLALELSLNIIMSQACRYLRDPDRVQRERQFLKRELGTELNSCLSPLQRQMRRGGVERSLSLTPPQSLAGALTTSTSAGLGATQTTAGSSSATGHPSLTPQLSHSISQSSASSHDPAFLRLVQEFVQKVLK